MHQESCWWNTCEAECSVETPQALERVEDARALFRRTLANWVSDLLVLRREHRLQTTWPATTEQVGWSRAA